MPSHSAHKKSRRLATGLTICNTDMTLGALVHVHVSVRISYMSVEETACAGVHSINNMRMCVCCVCAGNLLRARISKVVAILVVLAVLIVTVALLE